jgi:hypothetical protein
VSWFYVDDGLPDHEKLALLPERMLTACIGLWTLSGAWSRKKLTGGNIPRGQVRRLGGTAKEAELLVQCGLWVKTQDGYAFHDWAEWQETPEEVEIKREQSKARTRRWRDNKRARDAARDAGVTRHGDAGDARVPGEGEGKYVGSPDLEIPFAHEPSPLGPDVLVETDRQLNGRPANDTGVIAFRRGGAR